MQQRCLEAVNGQQVEALNCFRGEGPHNGCQSDVQDHLFVVGLTTEQCAAASLRVMESNNPDQASDLRMHVNNEFVTMGNATNVHSYVQSSSGKVAVQNGCFQLHSESCHLKILCGAIFL